MSGISPSSPLPPPLERGKWKESTRGRPKSFNFAYIEWYCTTPSGEACPWEKSYARDLEVKRMKLEKNRPVLNHLVDGHVRLLDNLSSEWARPMYSTPKSTERGKRLTCPTKLSTFATTEELPEIF